MTSKTGVITFLLFNIIIKYLHICLTYQPKATYYLKNAVKLFTEIIFLR